MPLLSILLGSVALLASSIFVNHLGMIASAYAHAQSSSELIFEFLVTTAGLLFFALPPVVLTASLVAFAMAKVAKNPHVSLPHHATLVFIIISLFTSFLVGYFNGSFVWPWQLIEFIGAFLS